MIVSQAGGGKYGRGTYRDGTIQIILPEGRLPRQERVRLLTLLVWGALGRARQPAVLSWARQLNEAHFGSRLETVRFHHQYSRWGSCSSNHRIYLSHRLLMAPSYLLRPVILHELAHLECFGHGKRFWQILSAADPDYKRLRTALGVYGHTWSVWWSDRLTELVSRGFTCLDSFTDEGQVSHEP